MGAMVLALSDAIMGGAIGMQRNRRGEREGREAAPCEERWEILQYCIPTARQAAGESCTGNDRSASPCWRDKKWSPPHQVDSYSLLRVRMLLQLPGRGPRLSSALLKHGQWLCGQQAGFDDAGANTMGSA